MLDKSHGNWTIEVYDRVIITCTSGAWNKEAMQEFCAEYRRKAAPILGAPWASLLMIDNWELGVPEFEPLLKSHLNWATENGLSREAAVFEGGHLREEQMRRNIPTNGPFYQRKNFRTLQQASGWLEGQGFEVEIMRSEALEY